MIHATIFGRRCVLVADATSAGGVWIDPTAPGSGIVARVGSTPESFEHLGGAVCPACKLKPGADGADPCLGHVRGAISACCGHGERAGSVTFRSGVRLYLPRRFHVRGPI